MAIKTAQVAVATTATALSSDLGADRVGITVCNRGANDVFVGGSNVTTANGYKIAAGESLALLHVPNQVRLFGIVAAATETVHVLEVGK